jgi:hypothetical protein
LTLGDWKDVSTILAAVAVPIIVALGANWVAVALKHQDSDVELIKVAVGILGADPAQQDPAFRAWAVALLAERSKIPLGDGRGSAPGPRALLLAGPATQLGATGGSQVVNGVQAEKVADVVSSLAVQAGVRGIQINFQSDGTASVTAIK